jgi:hypothetical protein
MTTAYSVLSFDKLRHHAWQSEAHDEISVHSAILK